MVTAPCWLEHRMVLRDSKMNASCLFLFPNKFSVIASETSWKARGFMANPHCGSLLTVQESESWKTGNGPFSIRLPGCRATSKCSQKARPLMDPPLYGSEPKGGFSGSNMRGSHF